MRNRLIHEYFSVDDSIVWEVAQIQLPLIEEEFEKVFLDTAPPAHRWRNCPLGYYFVNEFSRQVKTSTQNPTGTTSVRAHCRRNPSGKDQLYPSEIALITKFKSTNQLGSKKIGTLDQPQSANAFDESISLWTQYWNEVFGSTENGLHPNVVKALFFSESSFDLKVKDQKIGTRNYARGPMQISDQTRKILADENGELNEHYMTLSADDVKDVDVAVSAAIRWLFHKKSMASKHLKKEADWEEAVAEYKGYLRKKSDFKKQTGMKNFFSTLSLLNESVNK